MKYCIVCMKTVNILAFCDLLSPIVMDYHFVEEEHHFFRSCEGPFAETPPPAELEEDWQDHLPVPDKEELALIAINANKTTHDIFGNEYALFLKRLNNTQ